MSNKMSVGKKHNNVDYSVKILEVENLKKHFHVGSGKNKLVVPAVDDVSFDIYKREIFGLVGESGSGKTTTGRTIIKLYNPTEGSVKLNGIQVSAGHMEYVRNIRNIKKQYKKDLIALEDHKVEIDKLQKKTSRKIKELEFKKIENNSLYEKELESLNEELTTYKTDKYNLSEQYKLDLDSLKYDFVLKRDAIINSTKNTYLEEYKEELEIEKTKFKNKFEGLKDSAALTKGEIERRIEELKLEHKDNLEKLEEQYKDLIVQGETESLDKKVAKEQINELKTELKENISKLKEEHQLKIDKLEEPDLIILKQAQKELKQKYNLLNQEIDLEIKELKTSTKEKIAAINKSSKDKEVTQEEKNLLNEKKAELKKVAKAKIKNEKEKIALAKQVNNSKEALLASRKMQMIFQDPISSLNPRMTVREIIGEGLIISGQYTKAEINNKVEEILKVVGLAPEFAMRYPHEFSGGQRQRIGIARALIMNPNFVIADEPISALDVSIQAQVINLISELKDILDLTVLFIAHDLSVVRFFCDRVAVMNMGKIVELAETEELFRNPLHPYTKSLLSAIPQPDPDYEKGRKRIHYDMSSHDYRFDRPKLHEIADGHFVFANNAEFEQMKKEYNRGDK